MHSSQEDDYVSFNLAQLREFSLHTHRSFGKTYMCHQIINEILKGDVNINDKITVPRHLKDSTILHFVSYYLAKTDVFSTLLERGADFTIKDGNGQTVLHFMMTKIYCGVKHKKRMISSLMTAHVKFRNPTNPRDEDGISHLHGACYVNHLEAAELFLANGASIDEAVNVNALSQFAGCTPLHFAARYLNYEMTQMLVRRGANVNAKTARGMSPLDLLIEKVQNFNSSLAEVHEEERIIKLLMETGGISAVGLSSLHVAFTLKDLSIAERLFNQGAQIDYAVPIKSHIYPGKTALHLAVANSVEAVKMLIIRGAKLDIADAERQTPLDLCTSKYSLQQVWDILSCHEDLKDICLSDGVTGLLDLIAAMKNVDEFKVLMHNVDTNIVVPSGSKLWPGYTILHLAVIFSKYGCYGEDFARRDATKIVKECLNRGLNVNVQNVRGQTAIHLAFRQSQFEMVLLLLEHLNRLDQLENIFDEDNLSYLHIACVFKDVFLVEKLLACNSEPNVHYGGKRINQGSFTVEPGATPLHIATQRWNASHIIADMLLRYGADLHATDANGMTPIHWIVQFRSPEVYQEEIDVLYNALLKNLEDRVVDGLGLSYLHIACLSNRVEVIEKLLDLGSKVDAVIEYDKHLDKLITNNAVEHLQEYSNFTPLQMTVTSSLHEAVLTEILTLLLRRGVDIFAIIKYRVAFESLYKILCDRNDMRKCVEQKLGLTKLHIACYIKNEKAIKSALNDGYEINAQINVDSGIFAGCTPLHLFLTVSWVWDGIGNGDLVPITVAGILRFLLVHGADVTIANTERDTPIHVFNKYSYWFFEVDRCKDLLLNAQQDFNLNPVNAEGLSHFHLACRWLKVEVVKKFLHQSVDVNQQIDYFAGYNAGCTPLHLALEQDMAEATDDWTRLAQIVNLLLKHGADVTVKDVRGDTPLHKRAVLRSPDMCILEKLVSYGGNMKSKNIRGETPIEACLGVRTVNTNLSDNVRIFQKFNCKINSWNHLTGEGYIAKIFLLGRDNLSISSEFEKFIKSSDALTVDNMGRTAIHNSVAISTAERQIENYIYVIHSFIKIGIDIDHQDKAGQTALHYASRLDNINGVEALLTSGADVNIIDSYGKSALTYAVENLQHQVHKALSSTAALVLYLHVKKLVHLGLEVIQLNQNLVKEILDFYEHPRSGNNLLTKSRSNNPSWNFFSQIEMTKTMHLGIGSLSLFDFLSEGRVVNTYSFLPEFKRELIDDFSKSIRYNELSELSGILKLQFRKMKIRLELIDSVLNALRKLLGFSVPGLCEQISLFLSTSDLMNLINIDENENKQAIHFVK